MSLGKKTIQNCNVAFVSPRGAGKTISPELGTMWVPCEAVHDDSEVWWTKDGSIGGRSGKLILKAWFVEGHGLELD